MIASLSKGSVADLRDIRTNGVIRVIALRCQPDKLCPMTDILHIGEPPIAVHLRHNARAKRYSLRISNKDGKVSMTLPKRANMREATAFAIDHEGWLRKHLSKRVPMIVPEFGCRVMFDGEKREIVHGAGRSVRYEDGQLHVPGRDDQLAGKLKGYFKAIARERLVHASEHYAEILDRKISSVSIRDTKSRWGSCSTDGKLMYSWRLVMAPRQVQVYVAAHEACHLVEMNHSAAYWKLVEQVYPDYKQHKLWLKRNGTLLHSYKL